MAHTPIEKLVAYFSQQAKLQKNGEIKYNPHEVWEDAIGVCSNLIPYEKQELFDAYNQGYRDGEEDIDKRDVSNFDDANNYFINKFKK